MKRDGRCAEKHTPSSRRLPPADLGDPARQQAAAPVWFWAAYLMATHSNGISALQLQKQLGIGSYRSAWLLAHKLRASMVDPERNSLSGLVEIDEASLPFRQRRSQGRSHDGKMLIVGAIELAETSQAACGWPKSPPTAPPTSRNRRRSRRHRENRRLRPATLRSPPIATMSMSSGRPPLTSAVDPPSLLQPQRMGARRLPRAASQASAGLSR